MAEFQEVAKHWKRMCNKYWRSTTCHGCPIAEYERRYEACAGHDIDVSKMEENVLTWAAENPEPQYLTWGEYLTQIGVVNFVEQTQTYVHTALFFKPIPADIAQLLGIEPVPVIHGDCGATNEADARKMLGLNSEAN